MLLLSPLYFLYFFNQRASLIFRYFRALAIDSKIVLINNIHSKFLIRGAKPASKSN